METRFTMNWWVLLLRGIAAIVFGVLAIALPLAAMLSLIFVFGVYAIVDGILALVAGLRAPKGYGRWWMLALTGILGIAAGIIAFAMPGLTAFALIMLIAAWAIVTGIFEIVAAIHLRREITGEWMMVLGGIASVVVGVLLMINPVAGSLAVVWIIGIYAILYGIIMSVLGFKLHGEERTHHGATPHPA